MQKGNEAYAAQQYDEALGAYEDAQEIAPELAQPIYNTANTLYRQEGFAEAQQMMQQAIPQADGELAQFSQYNLGNFYFEQQNYEAAVEAYKEALRLNPNDQEAKHNLELAQQQLQQQQQQQDQQQNQNQDQEQQDQNQETADSSSSNNGEQQNQQSQSGTDNGQEQSVDNGSETADSPDANNGTASTATAGLSAEQARQLLGAIGQNTETLQEHLQQIYVAPGGSSQKDW